jgi:hypothetical protein
VLVGLWVPAIINLSGVKNTGMFQIPTTILKFAGLAFLAIVGLFYIKSANFDPFNVSRHSAIGCGAAVALFSYLGLETASVTAAKVRDLHAGGDDQPRHGRGWPSTESAKRAAPTEPRDIAGLLVDLLIRRAVVDGRLVTAGCLGLVERRVSGGEELVEGQRLGGVE